MASAQKVAVRHMAPTKVKADISISSETKAPSKVTTDQEKESWTSTSHSFVTTHKSQPK